MSPAALLVACIVTLAAVNLGAVALLYLQFRQAARERDAAGRLAVEIYTAAHGAVVKHAEMTEQAAAVRALLEQERAEVGRMIAALRPLVRSLTEDLRGGARP